jgi:integrase/recombinase XerD
MTMIAPTLEAWFTERLITQRNASPRTIIAYRDTLRLLLRYAHEKTGKQPCQLDFADLDASLIGGFLDHLEHDRGNSARTRNQRLAAIHSLYRYAALRHPEHADMIARVIEIPVKRHERRLISYLDLDEIKALLAAPDPSTWHGRRDHALLLLAVQTGLRVSELTSLCLRDITLGTGAHCRVTGKGRKERCAMLTTETVAVLCAWLEERQGRDDNPLFPTRQGRALTPKAVAWLLDKHTTTAALSCPSLSEKRVTPHVLRHTNAMLLRAEKVDLLTIALWLGHESTSSTEIYMHADNRLKQEAIDRIAPAGIPPGRYQPPDRVLAFLDRLAYPQRDFDSR